MAPKKEKDATIEIPAKDLAALREELFTARDLVRGFRAATRSGALLLTREPSQRPTVETLFRKADELLGTTASGEPVHKGGDEDGD